MDECLVHTGQHFDDRMSDIFFRELGIPAPKFNLGINSVSHGAMTGRMLEKVEEIAISEQPDWVVVYGDTNSTLAAALAAAKLHIPVAHIEAGLRSWNRQMPEEINRVLTDHISTRLFCSSAVGAKNLQDEGITDGVHVVGDVMADASRLARDLVNSQPDVGFDSIPSECKSDEFALLTLHRAENTDSPKRLVEIVSALNDLQLPILFPIHPRTAKVLKEQMLTLGSHIHVVPPLGYLEMTASLLSAKIVITDSGGLQKEAYWAQTPCVTLRDETEWIETIEEGWNRLAGADRRLIVESVGSFETKPSTPTSAYGDGQASERIAVALAQTAK